MNDYFTRSIVGNVIQVDLGLAPEFVNSNSEPAIQAAQSSSPRAMPLDAAASPLQQRGVLGSAAANSQDSRYASETATMAARSSASLSASSSASLSAVLAGTSPAFSPVAQQPNLTAPVQKRGLDALSAAALKPTSVTAQPKQRPWYAFILYFFLFVFIMLIVFFGVYRWLIKNT